MSTNIKHRLPIIILPIFLGLAAALLLVIPGNAFPQAYPQLSIPSNIAAQANSTVSIPVQFKANGNNISSLVFSIDYDEYWLSFDSSVPNTITLNLPNGFTGACTPDISDTEGEIDCFVLDPLAPLQALPDSTIVTVILRTGNAPQGTEARAGFSASSPPPSFGNDQGQSVPGTVVDGSVLIGDQQAAWNLKLPLVMNWNRLLPTSTPTNTPTGPTPTATNTAWPTPTSTGAPPNTPTPTSTSIGTCSNYLVNSGFENNEAWVFPATEYPASYSNALAHTGSRSARTGILSSYDNRYSYSSVRQTVTIPADALQARLRLYLYPITSETFTKNFLGFDIPWFKDLPPAPQPGDEFGEDILVNDIQYVLVLNPYNPSIVLEQLIWDLSGAQMWLFKDFNMAHYAGQTIMLQIGTYNDGYGGVSAMYADDVVLEVCR